MGNIVKALLAKPGQDNGTARSPLEALAASECEAVKRTTFGFLDR